MHSDFGLQLTRWRKDAGLDQVETAKRARISQTQLSRLEAGKTGSTPGTIRRIAEAVNVDPEAALELAGLNSPVAMGRQKNSSDDHYDHSDGPLPSQAATSGTGTDDVNVFALEQLATYPSELLKKLVTVFPGTFTSEAAHTICNPEDEGVFVDASLVTLCDAKLLERTKTASGLRFRVVPYAATCLNREKSTAHRCEEGKDDLLKRRHRDYFVNWIETTVKQWDNTLAPNQSCYLNEFPIHMYQEFESEEPNLNAALEYSCLHETYQDAKSALLLIRKLWRYYATRGGDYVACGLGRIEQIISKPQVDHAEHQVALSIVWAARGHLVQGENSRAATLYFRRCRRIRKRLIGAKIDQRQGIALSWSDEANIARKLGKYVRAKRLLNCATEYQEALLREGSNPQKEIASAKFKADMALLMLQQAHSKQDYDGAISLFEECLKIRQKYTRHHALDIAYAELNIGIALRKLAELQLSEPRRSSEDDAEREAAQEKARAKLDQSLRVFQSLNFDEALATAHGNLGKIAFVQGKLSLAAAHYQVALNARKSAADAWNMAFSLEDVAELAAAKGDFKLASQLVGAADGLRAQTGPVPRNEAPSKAKTIEVLAKNLGEDYEKLRKEAERDFLERPNCTADDAPSLMSWADGFLESIANPPIS